MHYEQELKELSAQKEQSEAEGRKLKELHGAQSSALNEQHATLMRALEASKGDLQSELQMLNQTHSNEIKVHVAAPPQSRAPRCIAWTPASRHLGPEHSWGPQCAPCVPEFDPSVDPWAPMHDSYLQALSAANEELKTANGALTTQQAAAEATEMQLQHELDSMKQVPAMALPGTPRPQSIPNI